jgi:hypothetical protein
MPVDAYHMLAAIRECQTANRACKVGLLIKIEGDVLQLDALGMDEVHEVGKDVKSWPSTGNKALATEAKSNCSRNKLSPLTPISCLS